MVRAACILVALVACNPKPDKETRCKDVIEHIRKVSAMPMRDGDVMMLKGACEMWSDMTIDCMKMTKNDEEIAACKASGK
jgi:hypothetical protein